MTILLLNWKMKPSGIGANTMDKITCLQMIDDFTAGVQRLRLENQEMKQILRDFINVLELPDLNNENEQSRKAFRRNYPEIVAYITRAREYLKDKD